MSTLLSGVRPYRVLLFAGDIGDGSKALGISVLTGFIISMASDWGDACAARRRRRPTNSIALPMTRTEKTYAPMIADI